MGAKRSAQMVEALRLIMAGKTAAEAARLAGVTKGAISKTREYRELKETRKNEAA